MASLSLSRANDGERKGIIFWLFGLIVFAAIKRLAERSTMKCFAPEKNVRFEFAKRTEMVDNDWRSCQGERQKSTQTTSLRRWISSSRTSRSAGQTEPAGRAPQLGHWAGDRLRQNCHSFIIWVFLGLVEEPHADKDEDRPLLVGWLRLTFTSSPCGGDNATLAVRGFRGRGRTWLTSPSAANPRECLDRLTLAIEQLRVGVREMSRTASRSQYRAGQSAVARAARFRCDVAHASRRLRPARCAAEL